MILPEIEPRPEKTAFRTVGVAKCAKALKVGTSYLYNVLNGTHDPSPELNQKIIRLHRSLQNDLSEQR